MSQGGAYYIIKRVRDWDFFNRERSELIVVKVAKPHPNITRGYRAPVFKKYSHVSLGELVDLGCVDEKLASLVNVYIREEEFEELMREYIHRCSKDKESLYWRLRNLEWLLEAQVVKPEREKKEYPLSVYYEIPESIYTVVETRAKKDYHLGGPIYVYVFKRKFCIVSLESGVAVYLPMDLDEVSVEASKNLDRGSLDLLGEAVRALDSMLKDIYDGDETLKTVHEVASYTLMLHEMFK